MRAAGSNQFSTARRPGRHFCLVISWSIPRGRWDLCRLSRVAYDYFCGRAVCRALPHGRYAGGGAGSCGSDGLGAGIEWRRNAQRGGLDLLGQREAPLVIRPYLAGLTRSELAVVMVSGMGLVSGGILGAYLAAGCSIGDLLTAILMSFPATICLTKMVIPETGIPQTLGSVHVSDERVDDNLLDAAARGTRGGLMLAVNVAAASHARPPAVLQRPDG